jgi:hypothetical protein
VNHKRRWQLYAPLGLALIGFGVSIVGYAVERRTLGVALGDWFFWGTVGLITLNAGVACFGEAVKHRVLLELRRDAS